MRCRLLIPGGLRDADLRSRTETYLKRAGPTLRCELVAVRAARGRRGSDALEHEARSLREALRGTARVIVLDERGEQPGSVDLAKRLGQMRDGGEACDFLIGSADGLHPDLKQEAHWTLALSSLTLPHEMAAVLLAEQLYRSASILRGDPYHRP